MEVNSFGLEEILLLMTVVGVVFNVYLHFKDPQIKQDQTSLKLREDINALSKGLTEVKEQHLKAVEQDLRGLTETINALSITVAKLSTVIDERMPKVK